MVAAPFEFVETSPTNNTDPLGFNGFEFGLATLGYLAVAGFALSILIPLLSYAAVTGDISIAFESIVEGVVTAVVLSSLPFIKVA